ncbi:MAG: glutamate synthase subunit beta [Rhodospirillaceae bacterium]|nr:glutamate synthase subunit beta [Rhodospirillaceae bacterium]
MGKPTGFMEIARADRTYDKVAERITHYKEFVHQPESAALASQGARCMDCGIPFCHNGCPVNNIIPDWNHLVFKDRWRDALTVLHSTNNFPEFTGRICPAPCEAACTLNFNDDPVTIKSIECAIVDKGWAEGWIQPQPPAARTGKRIAVVGSGPAGLAAAQQLARTGHAVTVFEKDDRAGGLLRYGIPDFKMEKHLIDRRIAQMQAEGVQFRTSCHVGVDVTAAQLVKDFDAVLLTGGAQMPRDLPVPGRELKGVHFAMDFLSQNNKRQAGDKIDAATAITAKDKHVVVIGGGDTGSDCIGTSIRMGAKSIRQLEIMPRPPEQENKPLVWPYWPLKFRVSSSQEEGCDREFAVATKSFGDDGKGNVKSQSIVRLENGKEVPGSEIVLDADLVLLAMGFVHPIQTGLLKDLGVALDQRGNVLADTVKYQSSTAKVFAAGDMRRGQSLVVWAIREGRQAARAVDEFLMGRSDLPR